MTWQKSLVAIRSLLGEEYVVSLDPGIVVINWNFGKRCNYDCSYCSPAVHDWISPHHSLTDIKNFVTNLDRWISSQGKTFKVSLTGGEPMVHPEIIEVLQIIRSASSCNEKLVLVTNGSVPLEKYKQALEYVTHLTVSLHLERSDQEIQDILDKIVTINRLYPNGPNRSLNVQVMCLPGKFDFIENTVIPLFSKNQVRFTLRRIRPWLNETVDEWQDTDRRQILKKIYTLEEKKNMKLAERNDLDQRLGQVYESGNYYSFKELEWLATHVPETHWQNIGVWFDDLSYTETNSDLMASNGKNSFNGWTCWAGLDTLAVEFDGTIYRGMCKNDGPIGHLGSHIEFPKTTTVCKRNWCTGNPDQCTRKAHPNFVHLVNNHPVLEENGK